MIGQNLVAQSLGPGDTAAMGPAPTVGVPLSWADPTSIYLMMTNDSIISGIPNMVLYVGTGLALYSLLKNRRVTHAHARRKKH